MTNTTTITTTTVTKVTTEVKKIISKVTDYLTNDKITLIDLILELHEYKKSVREASTPKYINELMYDLFRINGLVYSNAKQILLACSGYLGLLSYEKLLDTQILTAIDRDQLQYLQMYKYNEISNMKVVKSDILKVKFIDLYDVVTLNPPFDTGRQIIEHIVPFIANNGYLGFIMYHAWCDTRTNHSVFNLLKTKGTILEVRSLTRKEVADNFDLDRTAIDVVIWQKGKQYTKLTKITNNRKKEFFEIDLSNYPLYLPMIPSERYDYFYDQINGIKGRSDDNSNKDVLWFETKSGVTKYTARIGNKKRPKSKEIWFDLNKLKDPKKLVEELNKCSDDQSNFQLGAGAGISELKLNRRFFK